MKRAFWLTIPASLLLAGFALAPDKQCTKAVAVVHPADGQKVHGVVNFEKVDGGTKISWNLEGLAPGKHGFHIHEHGACDCPDLKCAGGHFNPDGKKHGDPKGTERHVGDLGNLEAGADGTSKGEMVDPQIALAGAHSVVGRAVMIHEKEDDLKTDPTGNAGGRFAAGVIGIKDEQ